MKIQTLPLRQALKLVSSIVPKNPLVQIFEAVKFEGGYLTASNSEVMVRVPLVATMPDCVAQYATLAAAANQLQDDEIAFDVAFPIATIKSGRTRIDVPLLGQPSEFPTMLADANAPVCTLSRADIERVTALLGFASTDNLRPSMTGVFFDGTDFVATNGHVLANYNIQGEKIAPCVLPKQLFTVLNSFTKATDYVFEGGKVLAKKNADVLAEISFRCIDERYPEWQNVVPVLTNHAVAEFEREEMSDAIDILSIGADKATQSAAFEFVKGGGVTASASDVALNKGASTAIAAYISNLRETKRIGFNTAFLALALKYVGGEMVKGYISEPNRAAIFKNPDFSGYALVMPVSV